MKYTNIKKIITILPGLYKKRTEYKNKLWSDAKRTKRVFHQKTQDYHNLENYKVI